MSLLKITRGKRGFKVMTDNGNIKRRLELYGEDLIQPKIERQRGKVTVVPGDKFYVYSERHRTFYFINSHYHSVMEVIDSYTRGSGLGNVEIVEEDVMPCDGTDVDFSKHTLNLNEPDGSEYDFQNPIVAHTSREGHNHNILEVQTGKGKTAMAMKTIVNLGKRTLIITKPGYVDKWTGDLTNKEYSLSLRPGELIRIGGGKSSSSKMDELEALIEMGRNGELEAGKGRKECKVILISSKTLDNWIKHQLDNDSELVFEDFMRITGCGMLLYDESHEWFRMNYWTFMLLNPARALDLSATLIPGDDVFIKQRYDERFPKICRYNDLEYDRYIDALGIYYHTTDKKTIDRMNRMKLYNHIEFEKLIMKRKGSQAEYFKMVKDLIDMFYKNSKWEKGQRALIFFASREMCTRFTEYAKDAYPDLDVKRNIQGDKYDEFVKADIGVSTPGKSGTAVDIPGLILTIVTVCLSKEDKNLQILGRTRKVRDWDLSPKAIFLHCQQLVKHLVYLKRRQKMFRNKVQSFKILNSKFIIK